MRHLLVKAKCVLQPKAKARTVNFLKIFKAFYQPPVSAFWNLLRPFINLLYQLLVDNQRNKGRAGHYLFTRGGEGGKRVGEFGCVTIIEFYLIPP